MGQSLFLPYVLVIDQSYENLGFYLELIEPGFLSYTNEKSNISIHYGFASL